MASSLMAKLAWMAISRSLRCTEMGQQWANSLTVLDEYFATRGTTDDVVEMRVETHARVKAFVKSIANKHTYREAWLLLEELEKP